MQMTHAESQERRRRALIRSVTHRPSSSYYESYERLKASLQAARGRKSCFSCDSEGDFSLSKFAAKDNLMRAYQNLKAHGGQGAGADDVCFSDLSGSEVFRILDVVSCAIRAREYRPAETRCVEIPKADGGTRRLQLQTIIDRTVSKSLQQALAPIAKQRLPRMNQSVTQLYKELHDIVSCTGHFTVVPDDIRQCFDNVSVEAVVDVFREEFSNPDLLWIIETVIRGSEGPERRVGIDQGSPFSPMAMEWLLHSRLDIPFNQRMPNQTLLRYVDNLLVVCSDAQHGSEALAVCEELLGTLGMELKHAPGDNPFDLREPSPDRMILGFNPTWTNQLQLGIPNGVFNGLREKLSEAARASAPCKQAKSVINGFLSQYGPAMTVPERGTIVSQLSEVLIECEHLEYPFERLGDLAEKAHEEWTRLFVPQASCGT